MHILSVFVEFGCDMRPPFSATQNLRFEVLRVPTAHGSRERSALAEGRNCLVFTFLTQLAFESGADRALQRGGDLSSPL